MQIQIDKTHIHILILRIMFRFIYMYFTDIFCDEKGYRLIDFI